ncbi:hypothetical protein [Pseudomonas sp. GL-R-26]|jgi:hypothetical protein|uniref:hypothetical protein n=1 Tax=Pseudomonas sp. GL-R-26 TaxID=2832392 RepID=UPI001CC16613|nr:hypothetical protein [Pseudomonas sp. GL-R-26]
MALYKSACTARFHSSLQRNPVSGCDQLFLSALSCRRHIHHAQWDQPKGFGPSTKSLADAGLFHCYDMFFTKRSQDGAQIESTKGFDPKQKARHCAGLLLPALSA